MSYRDHALPCARCGTELERPNERDCWQCPKCRGLLCSVEEAIKDLLAVAPDSMPADHGPADLVTVARRTVAPPVACAMCGSDMDPVLLGGVELARCYHDELLWFDSGEHALVLDHARDQQGDRAKSWFKKLF